MRRCTRVVVAVLATLPAAGVTAATGGLAAAAPAASARPGAAAGASAGTPGPGAASRGRTYVAGGGLAWERSAADVGRAPGGASVDVLV
ncbi:MAG: hypothetical protein ACRDYD_04555, partial [Acidimicrobiales bacterium]